MFGFIPLAIYQWHATGAWWATTYSAVITGAPTLRVLGKYLAFYLTKGPGSVYVAWPLVIGFAFWFYCRSAGYRHLARVVFGAWWLSALFFCTHVPAVPYYLLPAHITLVWCAAALVVREESVKGVKSHPCLGAPGGRARMGAGDLV